VTDQVSKVMYRNVEGTCSSNTATGGSLDARPDDCYARRAVTAKPAGSPIDTVRAEQAARVAAMLERWAAEDVSDESEWDIGQIERIRFSPAPAADTSGS